ncbi:hypothetical protein ACLB2K_071710 [Fragaria x ananassa]
MMKSEGGGPYCSKKTDDYCAGESGSLSTMSRVGCILRGFDIRALIVLIFLIPTCIFGIYAHGQKVSYFLRPLWESAPKPFHEIPHYYHENVPMSHLCRLHGWGIQSNSTFSGITKPLYFARNRDAFDFVKPRLVYGRVGRTSKKGANPFVEEAYQRRALDFLLQEEAGISDDDLLIMSDVDEIPSRHTINILRWCDDIPQVLHLRLKNYLYSFEFLVDNKSWRASVHRYQENVTKYAHFRQTDDILADAGWHCSFCFRRIRCNLQGNGFV